MQAAIAEAEDAAVLAADAEEDAAAPSGLLCSRLQVYAFKVDD